MQVKPWSLPMIVFHQFAYSQPSQEFPLCHCKWHHLMQHHHKTTIRLSCRGIYLVMICKYRLGQSLPSQVRVLSLHTFRVIVMVIMILGWTWTSCLIMSAYTQTEVLDRALSWHIFFFKLYTSQNILVYRCGLVPRNHHFHLSLRSSCYKWQKLKAWKSENKNMVYMYMHGIFNSKSHHKCLVFKL